MSELQMESMRVPYSKVVGNVRWTGEYILLIPLDEYGMLDPRVSFNGGYRNRKGRAVYFDRSKYTPHQGEDECVRRVFNKGY